MLPVAAGTDIEQELIRLQQCQFQRRRCALALGTVDQRLAERFDVDFAAAKVAMSGLEIGVVSSPPVGHQLGIGPGQVLILVEGHVFVGCILGRAALEAVGSGPFKVVVGEVEFELDPV